MAFKGYKAIINFKTSCRFTNGRMIINDNDPEGIMTSEVVTLNFKYNVERDSFYIEVFTRNSVYLIVGVPHHAFVQLTREVKKLNLKIS